MSTTVFNLTPPELGPPLHHPMRLRVPHSGDSAGGLFGASRDSARRSHAGIDLLGDVGDPVFSVLRGRVSLIRDQDAGLGSGEMYLSIVHNPVIDGLVTRYVHLRNITVSVSDDVEAGTQIGEIGQNSLSHLHFETRRIIDSYSSIWTGGKEKWKNRKQHVASVPTDPTRAMYNWEARLEGFRGTSSTQRNLSEVGVLHKYSIPMYQVKWGGRFYHVPLYEPSTAEIELVRTLREAYSAGSNVRLATRDSFFFEKRKVITAVRVR